SLSLSSLSLIAGCEDCGGTGVQSPDAGTVGGGVGASCEDDGDCLSGHCQGGVCGLSTVDDDDAGTVPQADGGDEGTPIGVLSVLPATTVEFGAQLLGYPVTVDVTLVNVGNGSMTILAVLLDTDTEEFTATPSGTMNVQLAPGDNTIVRVTHTPEDGTPDAAE